jgi:zinc transport system substrate-binding protein
MIYAAAWLCLLVGCGQAPDPIAATPSDDQRLSVYVVNEPLRALAERIGGADVEVHFPAPPDVDPAHWVPEVETILAYQSADLILLNGAGYAAWTAWAALPRSALVDTSAALGDDLLEASGEAVHRHGPDGEQDHGSLRSTLWLDPTLAAAQARAIAAALSARRPGDADLFERNAKALEVELNALDQRLAGAAAKLNGAPILFSHPVYDYLIARYGLNARSLHWEPHELPTKSALAELDALLQEHPAHALFWEQEPLAETRRLLSLRGVTSIVFDPCGNRCGQDWLAAMNANAARMEAAARSQR